MHMESCILRTRTESLNLGADLKQYKQNRLSDQQENER